MKLSDLKVNVAILEEPQWQGDLPDAGDLRLKVRGMRNTAYRRLEHRLVQAVPRTQLVGAAPDPVERDKIVGQCLAETVLDDWENLIGDDGQPLAYSRETAIGLLTDPSFENFRGLVALAASRVNAQSEAGG